MIAFDYHRPRSVSEAQQLKATLPGARFIAGGTDMMVRIKNRVERPTALISLRNIAELGGIEQRGESLRIGAATTMSQLLEHSTLTQRYPVLAQAVRRLGSVQIRSAATIGGNLCNASPCADTATPLLVLEARMEVAGRDESREGPISEWFTGPGESCLGADELLRAVVLAPPVAGARSIFFKKGRVRMDLALVNLAAQLVIDPQGRCTDVRLAAGAVAPLPLRLGRVESILEGQRMTTDLVAQARQLASESVEPISDVRASADYRRHLVGVYVERALLRLQEGETP